MLIPRVGAYYWLRDRNYMALVTAEHDHTETEYPYSIIIYVFGEGKLVASCDRFGRFYTPSHSCYNGRNEYDLIKEVPKDEAEAILALEGFSEFDRTVNRSQL